MKVFTYFDANQAKEGDGDLLRLWKLSWERRGWETRLLTPRQAKLHPDFKTRPQDWVYQAFERAGGLKVGILSALNVINFGLLPGKICSIVSFPWEGWERADLVRFFKAEQVMTCGRKL